MNLLFVKIFSFFVGLFITLFLINYNNIQNKKIENFKIEKLSNINNSYNGNSSNVVQIIPHNNYKYMSISTYFDSKSIANTEGRWYDISNSSQYFTYDKMINLKTNKINSDGARGGDLNGIELRGQKSFYYANNITTNELTEFSMVMSLRISDITNPNNIIFEMTGNTEEIKSSNTYTYSMVNINIQPNSNNNYNFIITIGNNIYSGNINNINRNLIRNTDILVLGLIYTQTEITFLINKEMYKYPTIKNFIVKLGSAPVIINKNGSINMDLYNFTYYKSILPINEYLSFFKHNYHYLSGLNKVLERSSNAIHAAKKDASTIASKCLEDSKETDSIKINRRIDDLEKNLTKCFNKNKEESKKTPEEEIKPFDIKILEDIQKTSSSFFSFLFE
jgi:hypothetical protein